MAKTVDELIVEIKADTKDLNAKLRNIEGTLGRTSQAGKGAFVPFIGSARTLIPLLGSVVAGLGAIAAVRGVAQVGSDFEDLRDSLNTVFGSVNAGAGAFNKIINFAQTTPFQIESVSKAFIQLKGAGIEPSLDMLQTFADTASTSVDQLGAFEAMVRLVSRSAAGGLGLEEINQLDDRGIPATKILTEQLGVTRLELSKFGQTAEGAAEMVNLLISGMQERFGGAMAEKMDNLSTKTSNMVIAFKDLGNALFEGGLADLLKDLADSLSSVASAAAAVVRQVTNRRTLQDIVGEEKDPEKQLDILDDKIKNLDNQMQESLRRIRRIPKEDTEQVANFLSIRMDLINQMQEAQDAFFEQIAKEDAENFLKTKGATGELAKAFEELDTVVKEAGQTLSREFTNAVLDGKDAMQSLADFSKAIVSEIISTFLNLAVIQPILNSVFGGMGNFFGPDPSKFVEGSGRSGFDGGTFIRSPITLGADMSSMQTNSVGMTPIVVNQSVNFATGIVPTVQAEVTKMLPQIADVSKAAVLEANMRGGSFRRGMGR